MNFLAKYIYVNHKRKLRKLMYVDMCGSKK